MKTTQRGQSARKRFWKTFTLIGIVLGILEIASVALNGMLLIAPEWAATILAASGAVMAAEKWLRWRKAEIKAGERELEATCIEWLLGFVVKGQEAKKDGNGEPDDR